MTRRMPRITRMASVSALAAFVASQRAGQASA